MTILELSKGQTLDLAKEDGSPLTQVQLQIGWDAPEASNGSTFDLDASVGVFTGSTRSDVVYYRNLEASGIKHSGDDLTGGKSADGPDEIVSMDLSAVSGDRLECVVTLFNARTKGQSLADIKNAFIEVVDTSDPKNARSLGRMTLSGADMSGSAAIHMGSLSKSESGKWSFQSRGSSLGMVDLNEAFASV